MKGRLPDVTSQTCVDCGARATDYDHYKGYARENWLDVEPVCTPCHGKRSNRVLPQGDRAAVLLPLSAELIRALDDEADCELRSRNAQIEWILRQRYRERGLDVREDLVPYVVTAA
jgi:hypothetical protein